MKKLKRHLLVAIFLFVSYACCSKVPELPIRESSEVARTSAGMGMVSRFNYVCVVFDFGNQETEVFRVEFGLIPTNSTTVLQSSPQDIAFRENESVGPESQAFVDSHGASTLALTAFDQVRRRFDVEVNYYDTYAGDPVDSFYYRARILTNVFVGFRFPEEDGVHYGWVQFARSVAAFTNIFDLVAHDWNPIPGAAIRAGAPPEIPLVTEVVDDGAGGEVLRTSWNPGVASWIFETTDSLEPPVTWTEYPAGGTSAEIPLDGSDSQRYFRLRRP